MRLTEKYEDFDIDDDNFEHPIIKHRVIDHSTDYEDKLGQLEDIEEELGIDLITLFKALKNGCYVKPWTEIKYSYEIRTGSDNIHLYLLDENDNDYSLKDYGKTWALTKEELL